jgi:hypothetical protein
MFVIDIGVNLQLDGPRIRRVQTLDITGIELLVDVHAQGSCL